MYEFFGFRSSPDEVSVPLRTGLTNLWHASFTAVPIFFLFPLPYQRLYMVKSMHVYTHISDCTQTVYELPLLPNNTAVKHFYTNLEQCEVLTGYLLLGAGLAVTGPIRDVGQNVLQSAFHTGSCGNHSCRHILFLIAFLEEEFIRNIVFILCINYTI